MAATKTMSHWSTPTVSRTDHWSKLKSKSYFHTLTPTGNYICYCRPQHYDSRGDKYSRRPFEIPSYTHSYPHHSKHNQKKARQNTLALVGNTELSQQLSGIGSLHLPTAQQWLAERAGRHAKLKRAPSASSRRAKQGFKYWPQEACVPSKATCTVGSKATFLGIGVPRL